MLFDRLIRRIGRTARGSAAKKHQVVYYDIRINNVETAWSAVRVVWISGTGKQTRSDAVPVVDSSAQLDGGVTVEHTLYKAQREFLPKTVHIAIDAQPAGADTAAPFARLASLYLDIGTMCNGSHKGIVVTDARPSRPGAASGKVYQVQMRIEVPGLAAEKMAGARGGSGLDHLTTVSSYQDSLMFTSAPADLAHGPDGKGPELEAVHLESMSNLSEGHMPRAHGHDRHGGGGGDSTGDLALAHYDERQGQSSMLSENTEGAQRRLERRGSAHSSLTSEDLDDYDPADPAAEGSKGASPSSGSTATAAHAGPHGPRVAATLSGMHPIANEALAPVVEDPMDTAGAASVEAARDSAAAAATDADVAERDGAGGADDWQAGEHSASMPLDDEVAGAVSGSVADSLSVPLAAQHGRGVAAGGGPPGTPGQQATPQRSTVTASDSRGLGSAEHRAPGSLRKPAASSTAARRTAAHSATATPKSRTAQPSAAAYRPRPSPGSSSASSTPARSAPLGAASASSARHSYPMQTPRTTGQRPAGWVPSSARRPRRTAALRQSMEDAAAAAPVRKAPLDTGLPLKQKMIVRRDPLMYRKGQGQAASGGLRANGQGLGERRERRLLTAPSNNSRDDSSSIVAPSTGRSEAAFELALDVHKRKAAGAAPAAGQQARWVSKATVARRQQRRQQTDQRKSIAPGTPAFGTSVPALRSPAKRSPGPAPAPGSSAGSGSSGATRKSPAAKRSPPGSRPLTRQTPTSPPPQTSPGEGSPPLPTAAQRGAADGAAVSPPPSPPASPTLSPPASPSAAALVKSPLRSTSTSPTRSPTKSPGPSSSKSKSPTKSPTRSPIKSPRGSLSPTKSPVRASPPRQMRSPAHEGAERSRAPDAAAATAAQPAAAVRDGGGYPGRVSAVHIGPRANLSTASAEAAADVAGKESPTCRTEVSSLSAVPQTLHTGQSAMSPTRSQAGVSELSIDEPDTTNPIDLVSDLTPTAVSPHIASNAGMHDLPERQAAATFIKELTSHSTAQNAVEVRGSIDAHAHAAGDADRAAGAAPPPPSGASRSGVLEPGGGNSRLSVVSHASGGPLSALDAVESGSSSISMSNHMGPTASRASSDCAGTDYAATGRFVDSIVDGQVLGWMNATSATYYQPE